MLNQMRVGVRSLVDICPEIQNSCLIKKIIPDLRQNSKEILNTAEGGFFKGTDKDTNFGTTAQKTFTIVYHNFPLISENVPDL